MHNCIEADRQINEELEPEIKRLQKELDKALERIVQLELELNLEFVDANKNKIQILEKQIELLEAVVRYWKWRVVGNEDVEPGEEYLIEER